MFFSVSNEPKHNFSHQYKLGNFCIGTDAGWHEQEVGNFKVLYKGYADDNTVQNLLDSIVLTPHPVTTGNYCVLALDVNTGTLSIKTDKWRSFPIYVNTGHEITNLTPLDITVWTDFAVVINPDLTYTEHKLGLLNSLNADPLSHEEGIARLDAILTNKTKSFLQYNTLPIKAFMSGGIDSTLVYSFLSKLSDNFEHVTYNILEWDEFWMKNSGTLQKNWAYKQIHHWREDCVLTTGSPGDEFTLRSPSTANLYLYANGTSIPELNSSEKNLHYSYYNQEKHLKLFKEQEPQRKHISNLPSRHLNKLLCNILLNDYQHWHLGKTLTWTPLRDLDVLTTILRMPYESVVGQILNSNISTELMERNVPGISKAISDQKNTGNALCNLFEFYSSMDAM